MRASRPSPRSSTSVWRRCTSTSWTAASARPFYDRKSTEWRAEQERLLAAIEDHRQANRTYVDAGVRLLELASRAHELFLKQEAAGKRELLKFVVSNSIWRDGQLSISYRPPFDLILEGVSQAVKNGRTNPSRVSPAGNFAGEKGGVLFRVSQKLEAATG